MNEDQEQAKAKELRDQVAELDEVIVQMQPLQIAEPVTKKRGAANLGRAAYAKLKKELAGLLTWRPAAAQPPKAASLDDRRRAEAESRRRMKQLHDDAVRKNRIEVEIAERQAKRERGAAARQAEHQLADDSHFGVRRRDRIEADRRGYTEIEQRRRERAERGEKFVGGRR